jgi:hypothetical protein
MAEECGNQAAEGNCRSAVYALGHRSVSKSDFGDGKGASPINSRGGERNQTENGIGRCARSQSEEGEQRGSDASIL